MNATAQTQDDDPVLLAFGASGFMTKARLRQVPNLSSKIVRIEVMMGMRWAKEVEAARRGPHDQVHVAGLSNEERERQRKERETLVVSWLNEPRTREDVAVLCCLTEPQAAEILQRLVREQRAFKHGKIGHHWTYINQAGLDAIDAQLRLESAARKRAEQLEEARPKSRVELRAIEVQAMVALGLPRNEIASRLGLSHTAVRRLAERVSK